MASTKKFKCSNCNFEVTKWVGKCPDCGSWDTFVEETVVSGKGKEGIRIDGPFQTPMSIENILETMSESTEQRFYEFSSPILNEFWSKGLVAGSFLLLAGEPGLGKSTMALQLLRSLHDKNKNKILYISAEESIFELARRADRLKISKQILLLQTNHFEQIEKTLLETRPNIVVLDSVQTFYSTEMNSNPGSIMQVAYLASQLLSISKNYNISIILIGHVTKDGSIAGPKTLEHLVDSVLLLEKSDVSGYRTMMFSKHRYGATDKQLLLKMVESGLEIVTNPSLALLENLETGLGVCYGLAIEKSVPFVVEIQVLVSKASKSEENYGRREAINLKLSKLNTILAIAEKYLSINLRSRDVYLQISGLAKNLTDDSLDLPILMAIISSVKGVMVEDIITTGTSKSSLIKTEENYEIDNIQTKQGTKSTAKSKAKTTQTKKPIFTGRLTLSGQLRNPTSDKERTKTALDLGFDYNPKIVFGDLGKLF
jgi:DNA repair protein RadA/Sms